MNYLANLCAATKIYERLILQRIQEIEKEQKVDLTNEIQYGFKKQRSTTTAGQAIQSVLVLYLSGLNLMEGKLTIEQNKSVLFNILYSTRILLQRIHTPIAVTPSR